MSNPPAAWYPDPLDPQQVRYWDGTTWTEHRAPRVTSQEAPTQQHAPVQQQAQDRSVATPATSSNPQAERRPEKVGFLAARKVAAAQAEELEHLRAELARLGALDIAELTAERDRLAAQAAEQRTQLHAERAGLQAELAELRQRVVITQDEEVLQEVGIYTYRHPLASSVAYKDQVALLQQSIKAAARADGDAIQATTSWQVNGSLTEGRRMVRDFSKLMLRAYNAEADNLVRGMKPYKLDSAIDRLNKVATTIEKLGKTMSIRVGPAYHRLRLKELELTADYQEILAKEKEAEREERARLREEKKAQQEFQRERERLDKERQHYLNALAALEASGDTEAAERMQAQLADVTKALEVVDYRAANIKAGYVYVISNLGAFGEHMVKVGLTRRLDPMDRIKELSDASVPFNFDVHALFFSENAVDIETKMHQALAAKRVNRVNLRREFFYATPAEARDLLISLTGELLQFDEMPEALEYHQSQNEAPSGATAGAPAHA